MFRVHKYGKKLPDILVYEYFEESFPNGVVDLHRNEKRKSQVCHNQDWCWGSVGFRFCWKTVIR